MIVMEKRHESVTIPVEKGQTVPIRNPAGLWTAPEAQGKAISYLSQVGELDRQIRLKKAKLDVLRDALSLQSPVMSDMPKAPSPSLQSMENRLCDILTLEDEIKVLEQKMVVLKAEMMGMIGKIEDATLQMILVQCFLNMRSNTQASKDLHFTRCWFIRLKNQALEAMEQVLSEKKGE